MSKYTCETKRVALHIKRLASRVNYLRDTMLEIESHLGATGRRRHELEALEWVLGHIDRTREIAFSDARARDLANPAYHAMQEELRAKIAARELMQS